MGKSDWVSQILSGTRNLRLFENLKWAIWGDTGTNFPSQLSPLLLCHFHPHLLPANKKKKRLTFDKQMSLQGKFCIASSKGKAAWKLPWRQRPAYMYTCSITCSKANRGNTSQPTPAVLRLRGLTLLFNNELTLGKDTWKIQLPDALLGLIRWTQKYLQIGRKNGLGGTGSCQQTWGPKFHPQNPHK